VAQPPSKPEAAEKEEAEATAGVENASAPTTVERKPRLLERIASLGKS
jgi:hypothetical protein